MNKKISTRVGMITSLCILAFNLFLMSQKTTTNSPLNLIQFALLLLGIVISFFILTRHYAGITLLDYFKHGFRTLATILFLIIVGNTILYFVFAEKNTPFSTLTFMIMKTIFSYSLSGGISTFLTSIIFNTFTKNK